MHEYPRIPEGISITKKEYIKHDPTCPGVSRTEDLIKFKVNYKNELLQQFILGYEIEILLMWLFVCFALLWIRKNKIQ